VPEINQARGVDSSSEAKPKTSQAGNKGQESQENQESQESNRSQENTREQSRESHRDGSGDRSGYSSGNRRGDSSGDRHSDKKGDRKGDLTQDVDMGRWVGGEVSSRALRLPMMRLFEHPDSPVPREKLSMWLEESNDRISWEDFQDVLSGLGALHTDTELMDIGADGIRSVPFNLRTTIGRWFMTLDDAYRLVTTPRVPVEFVCLKAVITPNDHTIVVSIVCVDGYTMPHPSFAWMILGSARELARAFGHVGFARTWTAHRTIFLEIERNTSKGWLSRMHGHFSAGLLALIQARHIARVYAELATRTRYLAVADETFSRGQQEALAQRRQLEDYFSEVDDIVVEYDRFNRPIFISSNAERILGYPMALLAQQPFTGMVPKDKLEAFSQFTGRLQFEDVSGTYSTNIVLASGEERAAKAKVIRIPVSNGAFNWRVVVTLDAQNESDSSGADPAVQRDTVAEVDLEESPRRQEFWSQKIVLIVDDDARVRSVVRAAVERLGYLPYEAESGEAALSMLNNEGLRPDALILDISLPGANGDAVFARIRKWLDVPVVFLTASPEVVPLDLAKTAIVSKPFRVVELTEKLTQLVERPHVRNA